MLLEELPQLEQWTLPILLILRHCLLISIKIALTDFAMRLYTAMLVSF